MHRPPLVVQAHLLSIQTLFYKQIHVMFIKTIMFDKEFCIVGHDCVLCIAGYVISYIYLHGLSTSAPIFTGIGMLSFPYAFQRAGFGIAVATLCVLGVHT